MTPARSGPDATAGKPRQCKTPATIAAAAAGSNNGGLAMRKRQTCFMCKRKPSKPLTACLGDEVYIHAEGVNLFCSLRCAANYALLWGAESIVLSHHFCMATGDWEYVAWHDCHDNLCRAYGKEVAAGA